MPKPALLDPQVVSDARQIKEGELLTLLGSSNGSSFSKEEAEAASRLIEEIVYYQHPDDVMSRRADVEGFLSSIGDPRLAELPICKDGVLTDQLFRQDNQTPKFVFCRDTDGEARLFRFSDYDVPANARNGFTVDEQGLVYLDGVSNRPDDNINDVLPADITPDEEAFKVGGEYLPLQEFGPKFESLSFALRRNASYELKDRYNEFTKEELRQMSRATEAHNAGPDPRPDDYPEMSQDEPSPEGVGVEPAVAVAAGVAVGSVIPLLADDRKTVLPPRPTTSAVLSESPDASRGAPNSVPEAPTGTMSGEPTKLDGLDANSGDTEALHIEKARIQPQTESAEPAGPSTTSKSNGDGAPTVDIAATKDERIAAMQDQLAATAMENGRLKGYAEGLKSVGPAAPGGGGGSIAATAGSLIDGLAKGAGKLVALPVSAAFEAKRQIQQYLPSAGGSAPAAAGFSDKVSEHRMAAMAADLTSMTTALNRFEEHSKQLNETTDPIRAARLLESMKETSVSINSKMAALAGQVSLLDPDAATMVKEQLVKGQERFRDITEGAEQTVSENFKGNEKLRKLQDELAAALAKAFEYLFAKLGLSPKPGSAPNTAPAENGSSRESAPTMA